MGETDDDAVPNTASDSTAQPTSVAAPGDVVDTFPRQSARTQRFTLGEPRNITVSPDGKRIVFLRSHGGTDPVNCLWTFDAATGVEQLVADPGELATRRDTGDDEQLSPEELARRERLRESASGITAYATDDDVRVAAFACGGRLYTAGLLSAQARELHVGGPVFDPRPDPTARRVAYVAGSTLCVTELDGSARVLAGGDEADDNVSWGSADFIAAEEMRRYRGYWWSPDGAAIAACRVDVSEVESWTIADPASPGNPPSTIRYPAAGTTNPDVRLFVLSLAGDGRVEIDWDRQAFPYLADVRWDRAPSIDGASEQHLVLTMQSRDQRTLQIMRADPTTGSTTTLFVDRDDAWVELVPGTPRLDRRGRLITCGDQGGARRVLVDGEPITPADQQVRAIVSVADTSTDGLSAAGADDVGAAEPTGTVRQTVVVYVANPIDDATVQHVWRVVVGEPPQALTDEPGVHNAVVGGPTTVIRTSTLDEPRSATRTLDGLVISSYATLPLVEPRLRLISTGERNLATAVLLPNDIDRFAGQALPVLLDPYGGPHAQRVTTAQSAYLTSQWFADHGFVVIVIDGRGSPGRGTTWEREIAGDLASAPIDDQVDGLHGTADWLADREGDDAWSAGITCDLSRVAMRGWSFGGYLSALAVLRRPDVFRAAVAGAPVTEWRLYDTHYTERYLGNPTTDPGPYDRSSLLPLAGDLRRPLLLIHGLADDNVVAAHTLQLSSALLGAGRPHEVLPLVGVTHMTPQEVVAENLLLHQLDFLRRHLGANT